MCIARSLVSVLVGNVRLRLAGVLADDRLMMAYDLGDDEVQELLGELGVKLGVLRQRPQASDLLGLACGVGGRQTVRCLQLTDLLGDLEPLGEEMHQGRIHVVDAHPQPQQLLGHRVIHGAQPNQWRAAQARHV